MPSAAERAETREISDAIVESVRNDERMPLPGLVAIPIQWRGLFYNCEDVETFVFRLAFEITLLLEDRRAFVASTVIPPKEP